MEYNEKWTKEKFIEYRKLKRTGYSDKMLIDHFGEDIYHSGLYNKHSPNVLRHIKVVNEIKVNPEETKYTHLKTISVLDQEKNDYLITFTSNGVIYVLYLMYFKINNIETYNIIFTTEYQWREYQKNLLIFSKKGFIEEDEFITLSNIISKPTNLNDLFPIFRKLSWIIMDFYNQHLKSQLLSIGHTEDDKKINLYRSIIKDSFHNIKESEMMFNNQKYYIFEIYGE